MDCAKQAAGHHARASAHGGKANAPGQRDRARVDSSGPFGTRTAGPTASIVGTTDQFLTTSGFTIAVGRFISAAEVEGGRPGLCHRQRRGDQSFPRESPLGKKIKIGERQLEVIGVLEKRAASLDMAASTTKSSSASAVCVQLLEAPRILTSRSKSAELDQLDDAKEELRGLMRKIRHVAPGGPG
jgi:putative ABC transport system permease protein